MKLFHILAVLLFAALSYAQSGPPSPDPTPGSTTSFAMNLTPVTLPGGHTTLAGISSGVAFTISPNFDVKNLNIAASNLQYYSAGFNYRLPVISKALNNVSPNINFLAFQPYVNATVGADYAYGQSSSHYALTAGGGVDYYLNNTWSFGAEADYAKFPGFNNNTVLIFFGPKWHF